MIDWFTVAAQIVNFLILVALLKYFLYGRIVYAMDRREQSIAQRWNSAEQREAELQQELAYVRKKSIDLDRQRDNLKDEVRDEIESYRDELTVKARKEAELAKTRWAESLQDQTEAFLKDLRKRSTEQILSIVRKVLSDLSDAELEERIAQSFIRQLDQLSDEERAKIDRSFENSGFRAVIQSAFEPPAELQIRLTSKLKEKFGDKLDVRYERSDDLICGIALQTNSHKVAWDLGDYLRYLDEEIRQTLEEETTNTLTSLTTDAAPASQAQT